MTELHASVRPTVDQAEIARFDDAASDWWDPNGPLAPLHKMQPVRLDFILDQIRAQFGVGSDRRTPLEGVRLLDVGCGGGLLSEPMARLGASVVGLDASERAIAAAKAHAETIDLDIDYRATTLEALCSAIDRGEEKPFDVALAFEVVEHVAERDVFLRLLTDAVRPSGLALLSTLNQTARSLLLGVVAAEYFLGWLPRGTHDWRRFISPEAMADKLRDAGLTPVDRVGFVYEPLADRFKPSRSDLTINYAMAAVKGG